MLPNRLGDLDNPPAVIKVKSIHISASEARVVVEDKVVYKVVTQHAAIAMIPQVFSTRQPLSTVTVACTRNPGQMRVYVSVSDRSSALHIRQDVQATELSKGHSRSDQWNLHRTE